MFKTDTAIEAVDIAETVVMSLMLLVKKILNKEPVDIVISEFVSEVMNAKTYSSKIYACYSDLSSMNAMANNRLSKMKLLTASIKTAKAGLKDQCIVHSENRGAETLILKLRTAAAPLYTIHYTLCTIRYTADRG